MGLTRSKRLREQSEFRTVIARGRRVSDPLFAVAAVRTEGDSSRFGFSISKRVGGAVVRNRLKRRLQEFLRKQEFSVAWDIVVTARPLAAEASFQDMSSSMTGLIARLGLNAGQGRGDASAGSERQRPPGS